MKIVSKEISQKMINREINWYAAVPEQKEMERVMSNLCRESLPIVVAPCSSTITRLGSMLLQREPLEEFSSTHGSDPLPEINQKPLSMLAFFHFAIKLENLAVHLNSSVQREFFSFLGSILP